MKLNQFNESEYGNKSEFDYLKLEEGANKVRIVSEFGKRYQHFKKGECLGVDLCQSCKEGLNPTVSFMCWVIDRRDSKIKLAQFGIMIIKQLAAFSKDPQYQFETFPGYDITIQRTGQMKETKYTVLPDRKDVSLTENETIAVNALEDINQLVIKMHNSALKKVNKENTEPGVSEIKLEDIPF